LAGAVFAAVALLLDVFFGTAREVAADRLGVGRRLVFAVFAIWKLPGCVFSSGSRVVDRIRFRVVVGYSPIGSELNQPTERRLRTLLATASSCRMSQYPEKYLEGIRLFNEQEFFECHEVLEELWSETLGEEKKFYQGLIQAAVALFHFGNENLGGARKLYESSRLNLQHYGSFYQGLDLEKFHADMKTCFRELLESTQTYPAGVELVDERIPTIQLVGAEES
jgi:predicted metal-dependent hydrolase